jgi:hypothetical protein
MDEKKGGLDRELGLVLHYRPEVRLALLMVVFVDAYYPAHCRPALCIVNPPNVRPGRQVGKSLE